MSRAETGPPSATTGTAPTIRKTRGCAKPVTSACGRSSATKAHFEPKQPTTSTALSAATIRPESLPRYLDAVGDPAYNTAFGKMVMDPMSGHLRFTTQEVEAVRKVSTVESERAMSIGTGSAGGFAIPFVLDPSILRRLTRKPVIREIHSKRETKNIENGIAGPDNGLEPLVG